MKKSMVLTHSLNLASEMVKAFRLLTPCFVRPE